jgi:hypothetical protein
MRGVVADKNAEGHLRILQAVWESDEWRDFWSALSCPIESFGTLGLDAQTSDRTVWEVCQNRQIVLITGNRNQKGPNSLEATIRNRNQADSLPVITLGKPVRVMFEPSYAEQTAIRILEILIDIEKYLGAGRVYAPHAG